MPLARLAESFAEQANACRSDSELAALLAAASRAMDFQCEALVNTAFFLERPGGVGLITYPDRWHDTFIGQGLFRHDPVLRYCPLSGMPFEWTELMGTVPPGGVQHAILEAAAREGVQHGFTVPINVPGEPGYSCSFACRAYCPMPFDRRQCAWVVGSYAIAAARRLRGYPAAACNAPHLSPRELDCLRWVAAGKQDPEIAIILGVGLATVRTYVAALRRKFDVVSRTQLPACALRAGLIGYEDAIPHA
jgi:LuxR family quorum-sensing system transcriptional regulator CciR